MTSHDPIAAAADWIEANRELIREIALTFLKNGSWPTRNELGRAGLRIPEGPDIYEALDSMPAPVGRVDRSPEGPVRLRVRALVTVPEMEGTINEFLRALSLASDRLRHGGDEPKIRFSDLTDGLGLGIEEARRVSELLLGEDWMLGGGSGDAQGDWDRDITERTRFVLDLGTVPAAYLDVEAQRLWSSMSRAPVVGEDSEPPEVIMLSVGFAEFHPRLAAGVPDLFSRNKHELAVLEALKSVEIRVRALAGAEAGDIGVGLMRTAFGEGGQLRNPGLEKGEQDARGHLFAGAMGTFKNPVSHRSVSYSNSVHAAEVIFLADLLHRLLDEEEQRLREYINEYCDPWDVAPGIYREIFGTDPPEPPF